MGKSGSGGMGAGGLAQGALSGLGGGKGGAQPAAPTWQPAEGQDFGTRQPLNQYLAKQHGYTGDFRDGQWGEWSRANLSPAQRAQNKQLLQAYDAGQWTPPTGQGGGPNLMDAVTGAYGGALQGVADLAGQTPDTLAQTNLDPYMNPYQQSVIDATMNEMNRQYNMQQDQLGDAAIAAGAFGGDRHGIAQAEMARNQMDQTQNWLANLNAQNFNQAQQGAKFDIGNQFQNKGMNLGAMNQLANMANMGFGWGRGMYDMQRQSGLDQFNMQQALLDRQRQQWQDYTNQPYKNMQAWAAGMPNMSGMGQTTQSSDPGLMGLLGAGLQIASMWPCWVAREVYGVESPKWIEFRAWMMNRAPKWLLRAYLKNGPRWAHTVKRRPWLKKILRPIMDLAL